MIDTAGMKFAPEARPSQYIIPLGNTDPTCMPLPGHFIDIENRISPKYHQQEKLLFLLSIKCQKNMHIITICQIKKLTLEEHT